MDAILRRLGLRAVAITPLGAAALAALAASDALQEFTRLATERRLQRAAEILGVNVGTAEGLLAAMAHELVQEAVISGLGSSLPKSVEAARIAGQAAALFEMLNPGTIVRVAEGERAAQLALGDFVQQAYTAFSEGRLRLQDGTIAQGWVEVFPELADGERRLGELPGFTPERIDQWLETYPAEVLGLPNHTGSPAVVDPTGNIISTPIPDEAGPNIVEARPGEPGYHTRAFVEWEDWPGAVLVAAQRAGYFVPAPIWDDLRSFDAGPFRGAFEIILAGYPCQPFSAAGKRAGADLCRRICPRRDYARLDAGCRATLRAGQDQAKPVWRTVEVLACPVTWRPHSEQIPYARRG